MVDRSISQLNADRADALETLFPPPPSLDPRVVKQFNLVLPETTHYSLKELVHSLPGMSLQRFFVAAIQDHAARVASDALDRQRSATQERQVWKD